MNAGPWTQTHRILSRGLFDARKIAGARAATFPSAMPLLQIDHVLVSGAVRLLGVAVPGDALSRRASDHLPLVVDFEVIRPAE